MTTVRPWIQNLVISRNNCVDVTVEWQIAPTDFHPIATFEYVKLVNFEAKEHSGILFHDRMIVVDSWW